VEWDLCILSGYSTDTQLKWCKKWVHLNLRSPASIRLFPVFSPLCISVLWHSDSLPPQVSSLLCCWPGGSNSRLAAAPAPSLPTPRAAGCHCERCLREKSDLQCKNAVEKSLETPAGCCVQEFKTFLSGLREEFLCPSSNRKKWKTEGSVLTDPVR